MAARVLQKAINSHHIPTSMKEREFLEREREGQMHNFRLPRVSGNKKEGETANQRNKLQWRSCFTPRTLTTPTLKTEFTDTCRFSIGFIYRMLTWPPMLKCALLLWFFKKKKNCWILVSLCG